MSRGAFHILLHLLGHAVTATGKTTRVTLLYHCPGAEMDSTMFRDNSDESEQ